MNIGQYKCTDRSCDWAKYENTSSTGYLHDWGIYSGVDGDCLNCSKLCSEDLNCGAFECQSTYCSWWKKGVCDKITDATLTATEYRTCRKKGIWFFQTIREAIYIRWVSHWLVDFTSIHLFSLPRRLSMFEWRNLRIWSLFLRQWVFWIWMWIW